MDVDDDAPREEGRPWGLWAAVGLLAFACFAAGLLVGVISDGNAEIMREFRERSSSTPRVASARTSSADPATDGGGPATTPSPSPVVADRRANNSVEWTISIAGGTTVAPVDVRTAALDADAKVEFGLLNGSQAAPVAALWVRGGETARIALPVGDYSVRTTALPLDPGATPAQPVIVPGLLAVRSGTTSPMGLSGDRAGTWRVRAGTTTTGTRQAAPRRPRRRGAGEADYQGLGDSARTGGTATYGG